jgi:hypothetical protein
LQGEISPSRASSFLIYEHKLNFVFINFVFINFVFISLRWAQLIWTGSIAVRRGAGVLAYFAGAGVCSTSAALICAANYCRTSAKKPESIDENVNTRRIDTA